MSLRHYDVVVEGLAAKAGAKFAFDSFRRFLDMYGDVVRRCRLTSG